MKGAFWLMGGDERSRYGAQYLKGQGFTVHGYGVAGLPDTQPPGKLERVILPFPSFQGSLLRGHSAVPVEELLCRVGEGTEIFGGQMDTWRKELEKRGGKIHELYGAEPLTTKNAALTVEGAICLAVQHSPKALLGANCLVTGFGRIGKLLVRCLQGFSPRLTLAARKEEDRAAAEALGCFSDEIGCYHRPLEEYDFIFNTVPASVFNREQLESLHSNCLFLELASQPGGILVEDQGILGQRFISAPGLPGRFSPQSAGELYAQAILELISLEEDL